MAQRQQQQPSPSRLLQLPGELRDRIYRYAITGSTAEDPIDVTVRDMPEPALLRTCKQIRAETIEIYHCENHFRCIATGFDSKVHFLFEQKMIAINRSHQVDLFQLKPLPFRVRPSHNWSNLKLWAQRLHSKEVGVLRDMGVTSVPPVTVKTGAGSYSAERILIRSIFDLARELRDTPWAVVEGILETTHAVLTTLDARWA